MGTEPSGCTQVFSTFTMLVITIVTFWIDLISTSINIISSSLLILVYVFSSPTIDLSTITGMTATLAVFNAAINSVESILRIIINRSKTWDSLEKEISMMENILNVYNLEKEEKPEAISSLKISKRTCIFASTPLL